MYRHTQLPDQRSGFFKSRLRFRFAHRSRTDFVATKAAQCAYPCDMLYYMNFLFPVIAAVLQAGSFTLDKVILGIRRINFKTYTAISFPLLFLIDGVIFLIFRPPLNLTLFAGVNGLILFALVVASIVTNVTFYRALKDDELGEMQTLGLLSAVPTILVTGLFFADERNFVVLIPAIIASLAVFWAYLDHKRFSFHPKTVTFLVWFMISSPFVAAMNKVILKSWNPVSLEMIRDGLIALVLLPIFYKSVAHHISSRGRLLLVATNVLSACAWILFYFSYKASGVVYTALLFSLQPLLVYFSSLFFLREPFHKKKFIAFLIVLVCIAAANILA